jgi:dolichyl-phosphate beta-glucosyltransferase
MRRVGLRLLVSVAIGATLLYVVFRQVDVRLTFTAIAAARWTDIAFAFALLATAYAVRAWRWLLWDPSFGYRDSLKAVLVGFMGNNVLPMRLGEVVRADWLARRSRVQMGRTAALASIAAERVLDGLALSALGIVGLSLIRVSGVFATAVTAIAVLFVLVAAVIAMAIVRERWVRACIDRVNALFPGHLTNFARRRVHYALDGVVRVRGGVRIASAVGATALIWGLELLGYAFIARSIFPLSTATVAVFVTVVNFASLFPATVGGIGAIEGAATAFLVAVGVPPDLALAMVLIQHGFQLAFTTGLGAVAYFTHDSALPTVQDPESSAAVPDDEVMSRTLSKLEVLRSDVGLEAPDDRNGVLLSIVIPAYNERLRLPVTVLETIRWCHNQDVSYEIIIVDDGSTDDTLSLGQLLEQHDRNLRTLACPHKGKGAAVRMGMLNARGRYVLFMDADGATPLSEIPRLLVALERGHQIAIGSRVAQNPGDVTVETSLHRRIIGRAFALFVNVLAVSGIGDTQCGFKMFRREVIKPLFSRQRLDGFAFDVELLYIARQLHLSTVEIPVNWRNQPGSKVSLVADSVRMLRDLSKIRWMHRRTSIDSMAVGQEPSEKIAI